MNEKPKRKLGWRLLRWGLIGVAFLVTLAAVLITEENWRGKRAWENYKRELEAKGEKLDWQAFVPPAVPDDQNFFCAPIFTNMLKGKIETTPYGNDGGPDFHRNAGQAGYAIYRMQTTDLQAWQDYYRRRTNTEELGIFLVAPEPQTPAKDVLFTLSKFDATVEQMRQASERPYARMPLDYQDGIERAKGLLPILAEWKRCTQLLQLRASAELADGQNAKALDDIKLLLRLDDSIRNPPFLISELVRMAILQYTLHPIWEGLAERKWSEEQMVALDADLAKMDFLADYEIAMRGELALSIASIENLRHTRELISSKPDGNSLITNKLTFAPSAFFYQNELAFARMSQQWILPLVDANLRVVSPKAIAAVSAEMKHYSYYKALAVMEIPALDKAAKWFAIAQTQIDLAKVAIALERYRLAHGEYPATLVALAPQFIAKLPRDIIGGPPPQGSGATSQPLHYRRTDDGKFVLYSVGWNEKDDGGTVALEGGRFVDFDKGDWVWKY
jgi:hypothetical protein